MEDTKRDGREESSYKFFETCCCCVPLRTGCFILGYLQLVGLIVYGIYYVFAMGAALSIMFKPMLDDEDRQVALVLMIVAMVTIAMCVITLPFNIALLVGLHKENRKYVKAYLMFAVFGTVVTVFTSFAKYFTDASGYEQLSLSLLGVAINIYFLLVLLSQYIKMGEAEC